MKLRYLFFIFSIPLLFAQEPAKTALAYFAEGREHIRDSMLGNEDSLYQAINSFLNALEINPNYSDAMIELAKIYYQLEEYDQSLSFMHRAELLGEKSNNVLKGNLYLALGSLDDAVEQFNLALQANPNAIDAYIGRAELALFDGNMERAIGEYREALKRNPSHQKALLSLAVVNGHLSRLRDAHTAIELALRHHALSLVVQETAASYYLMLGEYERANFHGKVALGINPNSEQSLAVLADAAIANKEMEDAQNYAEQLIAIDPENIDAWFKHGQITMETGDNDRAIESFQRALRLDDKNEVVRIALERALIETLPIGDQRRNNFANKYFDLGKEFERTHRAHDAANVFRRGLRLNPYSSELRLSFAEIYKTKREYSRYLQELRVINTHSTENNPYITESIETLKNDLIDSVSHRWDIDQYSVLRPRHRIQIFYRQDNIISNSLLSNQALFSWYAREMLQQEEGLDILPEIVGISSFSDALAHARQEEIDYFIIFSFQHSPRSFLSSAELYLASGALQGSGSSLQAGLDMLRHSLETLLASLLASIPTKGKIFQRNADTVLITIGSADGLEKDAVLPVLEWGASSLQSDPPYFSYSEERQLGNISIIAVDDLIAEGKFTSVNPLDRLRVNDEVYLITEATEIEEARRDYSFHLPQPIFTVVRSFP